MKIEKANSYLVSGGLTLHLFWILTLLKVAYPGLKGVLNFFTPVGPLLGVYLICSIAFLIFLGVFSVLKIKNQKKAYWFYVISVLLFVVMVFPPVFEPIAHALGG